MRRCMLRRINIGSFRQAQPPAATSLGTSVLCIVQDQRSTLNLQDNCRMLHLAGYEVR